MMTKTRIVTRSVDVCCPMRIVKWHEQLCGLGSAGQETQAEAVWCLMKQHLANTEMAAQLGPPELLCLACAHRQLCSLLRLLLDVGRSGRTFSCSAAESRMHQHLRESLLQSMRFMLVLLAHVLPTDISEPST